MPIQIADGIVNEDVFRQQPVKLLWVLKEANDTTSTVDWDMRDFLKYRSPENAGLFSYSKWRSTFGLICKVSYGILEKDLLYKQINDFDDEILAAVLDRIAYINIKKIPGGSVVDYDEFNRYISNPDRIKEIMLQIAEINPNIVVCGNTFHCLFPDIPGFDYNNDWVYRDHEIIYVNGWHPNAKIDHEKYFNEIRKRLQIIHNQT